MVFHLLADHHMDGCMCGPVFLSFINFFFVCFKVSYCECVFFICRLHTQDPCCLSTLGPRLTCQVLFVLYKFHQSKTDCIRNNNFTVTKPTQVFLWLSSPTRQNSLHTHPMLTNNLINHPLNSQTFELCS